MTVQLSPMSIPADGVSTSTVTVTVTDAGGAGVTGQPVTLGTSPPNLGITFSTPHDNGDGTYTSTLTSSTASAKVTIVAADNATSAARERLGESVARSACGPTGAAG